MNQGNRVKAAREIKGSGWGSPSVPAGSKGTIVKASMWSNTYTVTFIDVGWSGKTITIEGVKQADLQRA
jgi:hypothetical protein